MSSRDRAFAIALDVALFTAVLAIEAGPMLSEAPPWSFRSPTGWDLVRLGGFCLPLLLRRRYPICVLAAMLVAFSGSDLLGLGILVAFYSVGAYTHDRRASRIAAAAGTLGATAILVTQRNVGVPFEALIPIGVFGAAWILGETTQLRRRYTEVLEDRARQLEAERGESERRAAAAERRRIARDLHDIVAHRVSMITVQAGAAGVVVGKDPKAARDAISVIEASGRQTLRELRQLLDVLRDDVPGGADLEPRPGIAQLERLATDVQGAGTPVRLTVLGDAPSVPEGVQVSTFRIVQEALTNVVKHAGPGAEADVVVRCAPEEVQIDVTDRGGKPRGVALPGGYGLVGIRERAAVFGGTVDAGPSSEGGFGVHVRLPTDTAT